MNQKNTLLRSALGYAKRGWPVIPLHTPSGNRCSCRNPNCSSPGKHPRIKDWRKGATTDPQKIQEWWTKWPVANIGIVTGAPSGLAVLDIDLNKGGEDSLANLINQHEPLPDTIEALTGGGGRHILFRHPEVPIPNSVGDLGPGLDIRGDGGYIVASPSVHASGRPYEWELSHHPDDTELAPLPNWLLNLIAEKKKRETNPYSSPSGFIPEGQRNDYLTSLAGTMRNRGMSQEAIQAALLAENQTRCAPPLPETEVCSIAESIGRYPPGKIPVAPQWPEPSPKMFYGLAGDFVRLVEPHTEADPVALLVQFLTAFGNVIGRRANYQVEQTRHYLNLYVCLVGDTSRARKGTSWDHIERIFSTLDQEWTNECIKSGLSSGEGVIYGVRDSGSKDDGVADKRLLIIQKEFSTVLKVCTREGNILSEILRDGWDTGNLRILNKNSPTKATDAHISLIGHITGEELVRRLTETEMANGFGNRFLWLCVRRSKLLPRGGNIEKVNFAKIFMLLGEAVSFGKKTKRVDFYREAGDFWDSIYGELTKGNPGLFGYITARAEAQVIRLACLFALLDQSNLIRRDHLEAALAVWKYAESCVRFLFREKSDDPIADRIMEALKNKGELTLTQIHDLFGRHKSQETISTSLGHLGQKGLVGSRETETNGRPAWVFSLCEKSEISEKRNGGTGEPLSEEGLISHISLNSHQNEQPQINVPSANNSQPVIGNEADSTPSIVEPESQPSLREKSRNEIVQMVLDVFSGKVDYEGPARGKRPFN